MMTLSAHDTDNDDDDDSTVLFYGFVLVSSGIARYEVDGGYSPFSEISIAVFFGAFVVATSFVALWILIPEYIITCMHVCARRKKNL